MTSLDTKEAKEQAARALRELMELYKDHPQDCPQCTELRKLIQKFDEIEVALHFSSPLHQMCSSFLRPAPNVFASTECFVPAGRPSDRAWQLPNSRSLLTVHVASFVNS